jgi:hypothetical protein
LAQSLADYKQFDEFILHPFDSGVSNYLMIAGYGVLLFFTSNQATVLINLPYPPFGMATISFVGLSSYLLFVGIYASAVSVAEDSNLRKSIRKTGCNRV